MVSRVPSEDGPLRMRTAASLRLAGRTVVRPLRTATTPATTPTATDLPVTCGRDHSHPYLAGKTMCPKFSILAKPP